MPLKVLHPLTISLRLFVPSTAWWGTRHFVTLMLFMGMANAYVMRTNMSVAIVAMAKHTSTEDADSPSSNECPDRVDEIVSTSVWCLSLEIVVRRHCSRAERTCSGKRTHTLADCARTHTIKHESDI